MKRTKAEQERARTKPRTIYATITKSSRGKVRGSKALRKAAHPAHAK